VVPLELLLITGARLGDLLGLEWADVSDDGIGFLNTKNGKVRLVEMTPRMRALFASLRRAPVWLLTVRERGSHITTSTRCSPGRSIKLSTRDADVALTDSELAEMLRKVGGPHEARTRDLRVANAALSQLS